MEQFYFYRNKTDEFTKKLWLFALFSLLSWSVNAQCPPGNLTFTTQAQVNAFATNYPNCTAIAGNLYIHGDDITDLTPLNNIVSIAGNLHIENSPNLTTLQGLDNVNSITSGLILYNLPSLSSIAALSNVTSLGGQLNIYNTNLATLNGLQNITSINGGLSITSNSFLNSIAAIENIAASSIIDTGIYIVGNPALLVCYLDNICAYLANDSQTHPRTIVGNAGNCYESAISITCAGDLSYCTPMANIESPLYAILINSFASSGAVTNISNLGTGFSQNGYHDYTATHSISQYNYQNVNFGVTTGNANPVGVRIWVDWNKDFEFANDGSEIVYTSAQDFTGVHYGSFVVPGNIPMGDYRMRVILKYDSFTFDSCEVDNGDSFYGETEDYTLTILGQVPCQAPTNLSLGDITSNSANINWQGSGTSFDIEWGVAGFTQGTGTVQNGVTTNTYTINGLDLGTTYDFYVRNNCSSTQSGGISNWVKYSFTTIAATNYCEPTYNSTDVDNYGIYINSVQTNNAVTNISNLSSGYNGNGYGNFSTTHKVSELQGGNFSITISPKALNLATKVATVWVDWNKDNVFSNDEIAFEKATATTGNFNATVAVPNTQTPGEYRMRIAIRRYVNNHYVMNPCGENQYGEAEDYTLYVIDSNYDCANPTNIVATNISFNNATFNWTSSGSTFDIKYGLAGFTDSYGTFLTTNQPTVTIDNLIENRSYDIYIRQNCDDVFGGSSEWVKYTFSTIGYCVPSMNAASGNYNNNRYIKSVVTTGGVTNINNENSGSSIFTNYSNTHFVSQHPTEAIHFSVTPSTPYSSSISTNSNIKIWVDWNQDFVFNNDASELAYSVSQVNNGAVQNFSIEVPFGVQPGNYRMRIMCSYVISGTPCINNVNAYGETEDYTITVLEAVGCPTPTQMNATEIQRESATINWASEGNSFDIEWGLAGFTQGTGNATSTTTVSHHLTGLTAGISYDFYVRRTDCAAFDTYQSTWKKLTFTTTNYCVDYPNYITNPYISNFKTYHAETNIYNLNTGLSNKSYGNFAATHIASAVAGDKVSFQYTTVGSLLQTVFVWVDWNNDGILNNTNELVYSLFDQNNGTFNGNFGIPTNAQPGNYRMRLMLLSNYTYTNLSYNASSCNVNFSGETEDYTLKVLGSNACERPTNFTVLSESLNSLLVSWDSSGASFDIEYGQPGFALGSGIQDTSNQPNYLIANLDPTLSYDFYVRQNCGNGNKSYWKLYKLNNYCKPGVHVNSNYVSYYITNFSTTNGVTNISNLNSGLSSNNFGNFATSFVSQHQGENIDFSISSSSDTAKRYKIWVDWNNDGVYSDNATEMMHLSPFGYSNQTYQGTFTISANQQPGFYKMRVMHFMNASNESNPNVGPCIVDLLGEVEEYSLQVLENNCKAVTNLAASNIMPSKATLSWSSTGDSFDIEWGVSGFALGSGTQLSLNETTYLLDNISENTSYDFYVRQNCNDAEHGESYWRKVTFTTTSYCTPNIYPYPSVSYFIDSFSTTGAITNINNLNSGLSVNAYGNFSATHILTHEPGGIVSFSTTKGDQDSSRSFSIYVDWNKNGVFTSSERVYNYAYLSSIVTINGSFTIPVNQAIGNYRMRVVSHTNGMNHTTCGTSYGGEVEDYTLKIVESTCSIPVEITVTDATANSAKINWTTVGSSFDIEWGLSGFTLGTGTQVFGVTAQNYAITGLEVSTLFDCYVRQNCGVDGTSIWVKTTFNTTPYCAPSYPNQINPQDSIYIDSFTTSNGVTNINNTNTGHTPYSNYRNLNATQNSGESISFTAITASGMTTSKGLAIWIDWNKNAIFDANEKVFTTTTLTQGNISGAFEIPPAVATGDYRMRVVIMSGHPTNPCIVKSPSNTTYGEIEDYTLKVNHISLSNCASSTTWNGTSWNNGEPNAYKKAIIEGNLTIANNLTACELLLNSGIVTVNSGAVLTVNGQIVNTQNENNFIVQNDANLIQVDEVENTGSITVKRNAVIKHLDYSTWSSPVLGQKLKAFSPYTLNNRIRIYDAVANTWKIVENPETTNFVSGAGYMFRAPNVNDDGFYPNAYTWTGNFKGVPQNGAVTYNFSNATGAGLYQSIGNPYPSNISRANFHAANPQIGTLYFWTNTNAAVNGSYIGNNYATINRTGEAVNVVSIQGGQNSAAPNGYIAVGQGFVAETNGTINQAVFTNAMRTSQNAVYLKSASQESHRLWLNLSKGTQYYNQMLVSYNEEATNDVDFGIDSELFGYSGSALYSLINQNDSKYVIQGRALPFTDIDVVPLGFKATEAGIYKVSLSDFDGIFAENQNIFIKDNQTLTQHNLKLSNYEFASLEGTFIDRFEIVYTDSVLDVSNPEYQNTWIVYKQNDLFHIQTQGFEMNEVVVYDMLGRIVYSAKPQGNNHQINGLDTNGVYIVKIITNNNIVLNKKVQ